MITLIINLQDDCKARSLHPHDLSRDFQKCDSLRVILSHF